MNGKLIQNAEKFNIRSRRKRAWMKAMGVLGCVVVFCTVYALILPAITMEDSTFCGMDEHIHSEECYSAKMLSCTKAEMHTHAESCYAEISTLSDGHEHNDECYTKTQGELVCTISTEEIHTHTEACFNEITSYICGFEESEGHTHSEECNDENGLLICELEESDGHIHSEACIEKTSEKICPLDDTQVHEHNDECYTWEEKLICGITEEKQLVLICTEETSHEHNDECYTESAEPVLVCEMEEHEHDISCYSDFTADVEDASDWEITLPELTGDSRADIIAVADSQLGYKESVNNYIVTENGDIKGYTRYGQWYGDEYGDWCAMFVSFCLEYAGIDMPYDSNCNNWTEKLIENGLYYNNEHNPETGDIVFFDKDTDGTSDHVGIVYGFTENGISVIEGNAGNSVCIKEYAFDDEKIIGFGIIPEKEKEIITLAGEIYTDSTFTQSADDMTAITLTGCLPKDASVKAFPVVIDTENVLCAYDISIIMPDGTLFEPDESVSVSIVSPYLALAADDEPKSVEVYYVPEDSEPELVASSMTDEGISFEADHFSVYMVRATAVTEVSSASELKSNFNGTKTLKLKNDISINDSIQASGNVNITLDLNGKNLTYTGSGNLFEINNGSVLTIRDSEAETADGKKTSGKSLIGNLASVDYTEGKPKLTYYVTESEVINGNLNGATAETLVEYNVTAKGAIIISDSGKAFNVNGGTLNIESGFICGAETAENGYAVYQQGGTVNLNGGYICGFYKNNHNDGSAVYTQNSILNISGTVIAANSAPKFGAVKSYNSTINMSGGVISGNNVYYDSVPEGGDGGGMGGAGLFLNNSRFEMTGGYITNNSVSYGRYRDGGGAIYAQGNTEADLYGGYITGNEAAGGGAFRTGWGDHVILTVGDENKGPFICQNRANKYEGGAIALEASGKALIQAGYINNNRTETQQDWGGGGIFGANDSYVYIHRVLIAENTAEGFGGGLAGCSTGRVYMSTSVDVNDGGAIFDNEAKGIKLSGTESTKNEDHAYAEIVKKHGYADYFCAMASTVDGRMLGGYPFNWSGTVDGMAAKCKADESLYAAYMMALTASPSDEGKTAARSATKLFINGNYSGTHGGGLLCNGYMLIGEVTKINLGARIELSGAKTLIDKDGNDMTMEAGRFRFTVTEAESGAVISEGTNDTEGNIAFAQRLSFLSSGQYVYYIEENSDINDEGILFDSSRYRMTVNVTDHTEGNIEKFPNENEPSVPKTRYIVEDIKVEKQNGNQWVQLYHNENPTGEEIHAIQVNVSAGIRFNNVDTSDTTIDVTVEKVWNDNKDHSNDSVTVQLMQNGNEYGDKVTLSKSNGWKHTWNDLPAEYTYTAAEDTVDGYVAEYETVNNIERNYGWVEVGKNEALVEGAQYIIVSNDRTKALYLEQGRDDSSFTANSYTAVSANSDGTIVTNKITERNIYKPQTVDGSDSGQFVHTIFKNSDTNSWLLAQENSNVYLKGTTGTPWASPMRYENGLIILKKEWHKDSEDRVIICDGTQFTTVEANSSNNYSNKEARLYKVGSGSASFSTTIKITNTPAEAVTYGIDITKVSAENEDLLLAGAEFALLEGENQLSFVKKSDGVYSLAGENSTDTTRTLITNSHGKLVIDGLAAGEYILRETKAPDGYEVIGDKTIELSAQSGKTVALTIKDELRVYRLPSTGGRGLNMYTIGGTALLIAAAALLMWKYREESLYEEK